MFYIREIKGLRWSTKNRTPILVSGFLFCSRDLSQPWLLNLEVQNEQEGGDRCQKVQSRHKELARQQRLQQIVDRENQGAGGNRQATVVFVGTGLHLLALGLLHIEERQPDHGTDAVGTQNDDAGDGIHTHAVQAEGRCHAEAHHIAQGIQLNAEGLFVVGTVFLGSGHLAVEGIAEAGQEQAQHGGAENALVGENGAQHRAHKTHVGENHRIVIKSNKSHELSSVSLFCKPVFQPCIVSPEISQVPGDQKAQSQNQNGHGRSGIPAQNTVFREHVRDHGKENAENHREGCGIEPLEQQAHGKGNGHGAHSQSACHGDQNGKIHIGQSRHIHLVKAQGG